MAAIWAEFCSGFYLGLAGGAGGLFHLQAAVWTEFGVGFDGLVAAWADEALGSGLGSGRGLGCRGFVVGWVQEVVFAFGDSASIDFTEDGELNGGFDFASGVGEAQGSGCLL